MLDEIPEDLDYNLPQKANAVGSVVRFIVIDDSSKSGHLIEFELARQNQWVTIVLRLEGSEGTFMTHLASAYSKVITEAVYLPDNLSEVLGDKVSWAEGIITTLRRAGVKAYPWKKNLIEPQDGA